MAGYPNPEVGIHRGRLHMILYNEAIARLGADRIIADRRCVGVEQHAAGVRALVQETSTGRALPPAEGAILIACDGVNSALRKQFYPQDAVAFSGINTWRGVTRRKPILGGRSYMRIGSILTARS